MKRRATPAQYRIAKIVGGRPVAWFRYSRTEVWRWITNPAKAQRFRSQDDAHHAARSCSMCWQHEYRIETDT